MFDLTLDILDFIGEDFFGQGVTARSVSEQLASNPDAKKILIRMNSPGGDVFEGNAIYNMLRAVADTDGRDITVQVHGLAASMASVLMLAGSKVVAAENAMIMIHNPWGIAIGDATRMRKRADMLDKVKTTLLNIYERNSDVDREKLDAMMDAETWMTAAEAKELGFVDEVVESFGEKAEASDRSLKVLNSFDKTPTHLLRIPDRVAAAATQPRNEAMNLAQVLALLGLPADATEDQVKAKLDDMRAPPSLKDMVPRADLDKSKATVAELTAQLAKRDKDDRESKAQAAVDAAVRDGKISPASKDYHLRTASKSDEALAEFLDYVGKSPVVLDNKSQITNASPVGGEQNSKALSDEERKACAQIGISEEEFLKTRNTMGSGPESLYQ